MPWPNGWHASTRTPFATRAKSISWSAAPSFLPCAALEAAGFVYAQVLDVDVFLDGPQGKPSGGVRILYAGEKVRSDNQLAAPSLEDSERAAEFRVANLPALVRMKLVANRCIDKVHLRDLMDVGLIGETWPARFPAPLDKRLQQLLDDPNG